MSVSRAEGASRGGSSCAIAGACPLSEPGDDELNSQNAPASIASVMTG
ncbi:hypothetical protein LTSEADE_5015, partial [Salmonella enterica subsp. enterica serovar Adelaide str. A4-669]